MPYFVSAGGLLLLAKEFLDDNGAITQFLTLFGFERQNWLAVNGPSFWLINCLLGVWQGAGCRAIIYIATINSINNDLYEAACIDRASRWQRCEHHDPADHADRGHDVHDADRPGVHDGI